MAWITPKTNWKATDYINFTDFNRIEDNILDAANSLRALGYSIPGFTTVSNRTNKSYDDLASINRIENNLQLIRANSTTPAGWQDKKTWIVGMAFTFSDANRIENNTRLLKSIIKSQIYQSYTRLSDLTTNDDFQYALPFNTYYHDSRAHFVIDKSELTGMGLAAGDKITALSFYITERPGRDISKFTMALAHTNKNTADDFINKSLDEFTIVYASDPVMWYTFFVNQWREFVFSTPFIWDGNSNILVCLIKDGTDYAIGGRVRYVNVRPNIITGFFSDSSKIYPFDNATNRLPSTNFVPDMMITANKA
ncbi:hypothetical protein [Neobacillus sp. NPDC093127]|uniref:hypothetical protein n=1 Tax=Neobacillus sp. NPDC093127 TaxID=3364296 RepID=UPI0038020CE7